MKRKISLIAALLFGTAIGFFPTPKAAALDCGCEGGIGSCCSDCDTPGGSGGPGPSCLPFLQECLRNGGTGQGCSIDWENPDGTCTCVIPPQ